MSEIISRSGSPATQSQRTERRNERVNKKRIQQRQNRDLPHDDSSIATSETLGQGQQSPPTGLRAARVLEAGDGGGRIAEPLGRIILLSSVVLLKLGCAAGQVTRNGRQSHQHHRVITFLPHAHVCFPSSRILAISRFAGLEHDYALARTAAPEEAANSAWTSRSSIRIRI